jgi:hypothetical protein
MKNTGAEIYNIDGWTIWSPNEKTWICEPDWSIEAIEKFKNSTECKEHKTISQAKKWVKENAGRIKEENYLK